MDKYWCYTVCNLHHVTYTHNRFMKGRTQLACIDLLL